MRYVDGAIKKFSALHFFWSDDQTRLLTPGRIGSQANRQIYLEPVAGSAWPFPGRLRYADIRRLRQRQTNFQSHLTPILSTHEEKYLRKGNPRC